MVRYHDTKLPILTTTPAKRSARLTLIIPQAALMRSTILPPSADPFRTWDEAHKA